MRIREAKTRNENKKWEKRLQEGLTNVPRQEIENEEKLNAKN